MRSALLDTSQVRDALNKILTTHGGNIAFSQGYDLMQEWLAELENRTEKAREERLAEPEIIGFNRILNKKGEIVRDWWPVNGKHNYQPENNAHEWIARSISSKDRAGLKVETKRDIYRQGNNMWFRGKESGDEPEFREQTVSW